MDAGVRIVGRRIPEMSLRVFAAVVAERESVAGVDRLFIMDAQRPERMRGSKLARAEAWLHALNADLTAPALEIFGRLLSRYLLDPPDLGGPPDPRHARDQERLRVALACDGLRFVPPDRLIGDWSVCGPDLWRTARDYEIARDVPRDPAKR